MRNQILLLSALAAILASGCAPSDSSREQQATVSSGERITLNGSGATFPAPVYANWSYNYSQSSGGKVQVNYQGVGSGAGVSQIKEGTVDFAGTDSPLKPDELEKDGLVQFPMLGGGVVVAYNVPGVPDGQLSLSRKTLAAIFLGKITNWKAAELKADNPSLTLPDLAITVVHRSDASGTSFIFTNYLAKVSDQWRQSVGEGKTVAWPCGIGGQKNPGVCNNVAKIRGAIGYTEYTYALETKLPCARLENAAGAFVEATDQAFDNALESADWKNAPGNYMILTDAPGEKSYPIAAVTYLLYRKDLSDAKKQALFDYVNWCFAAGKSAARELRYAPMPGRLVNGVWSISADETKGVSKGETK